MKKVENKAPGRKTHRATTPEAREEQLISLAVDLAEAKLRDGTASNAMIIHYLKMGSPKERMEREILREQKSLMQAKTEAIKSAKEIEVLYKEAMDAMKMYNGQKVVNEEDEEELY